MADYIVDMGRAGRQRKEGTIVFAGLPEKLVRCRQLYRIIPET